MAKAITGVDLQEDPEELTNLYADRRHAETVRDLELLGRQYSDVGWYRGHPRQRLSYTA